MSIFENISAAISSVFSNKMRTFLTMIGIIIGVSSVITITALGKGVEKTIKSVFDVLNSKSIQVMQNWSASTTPKDKVVIGDVEVVGKHPNIKYISGYKEVRGSITLKNPEEQEVVSMFGSDVDFSRMQKNFFRIKYGRVFTEQENRNKARVCIIDEDMARKVFGRADVVGEEVKLYINKKDYKFKVVGVTDNKNAKQMGTIIPIPINTALDIYDTKQIDLIYVELNNTENLTRSKNEIIRILAANHNTTDDKYMAIANIEQVKNIEKVIKMFTVFIGFVAGISLLVGGIGVMNIMLVTVTERTREIGIRKSLGATNSSIKIQFLIESIFICTLGGIFGIVIGYLASIILGSALKDHFTKILGVELVTPSISMPVAIGAMLISTIVGVIFGVYPAGKAAKLNPIEALRYE
ncbi:ABC transporter permease [[Clostridium] colinum]|uniref:ABC transporter permease n=1 Tax=[Clostridium] colinum TaxID=36835 RepID=UPI002023EB9A|nr:ABC transporter permease [[Clostridium] colinum]